MNCGARGLPISTWCIYI